MAGVNVVDYLLQMGLVSGMKKFYSESFQEFYTDPMDYVEDLLAEGQDFEKTCADWDLVCVTKTPLELPWSSEDLARSIRSEIFDYNECQFDLDDDLDAVLDCVAFGKVLDDFFEGLAANVPNPDRRVSWKKFLEKNMFSD